MRYWDILIIILKNVEKLSGRKIFSPAVLNDIIPDKIIILTDYFDEIRRQIDVQFPIMTNLVEDKTFFSGKVYCVVIKVIKILKYKKYWNI